MKHVHVTGISPRSGTTLMVELLTHCFAFDDYPDHEQSLLVHPVRDVETFCSKNPGRDDLRFAPMALRQNPDLWIIVMLRDPRDIIVSRHRRFSELYFSNLKEIQDRVRLLARISAHPRVLTVRYEDLVDEPDEVQSELSDKISFLEKTSSFSAFSGIAKPSDSAITALGGIRPISRNSIGRWRQELPRVKGQITRYGPIDDMLRVLGYVPGDDWPGVLESVAADTTDGFVEGEAKASLYYKTLYGVRDWRQRVRFLLGRPERARSSKRYSQGI